MHRCLISKQKREFNYVCGTMAVLPGLQIDTARLIGLRLLIPQ
jgi:hypothetical protein